ncbi:MAG TPA: diacylglycerol kinase family protein [Chitinophagaceae bacterium]|nr:diacylglycerol kinase family protein [Chitinophagaceae bacterium]
MKRQTILSAFKNAFNGLWYFFRHERNGQVQSCAAIITIAFAIWLHVSAMQWVLLLLCIGAVLSLEMINSSLEKLCDLVHKDYHPVIKIVKDVSAAAVLFASAISVTIACIIFLPKMFLL